MGHLYAKEDIERLTSLLSQSDKITAKMPSLSEFTSYESEESDDPYLNISLQAAEKWERGIDCKRNFKKSFFIYNELSKNGNLDAHHRLGNKK